MDKIWESCKLCFCTYVAKLSIIREKAMQFDVMVTRGPAIQHGELMSVVAEHNIPNENCGSATTWLKPHVHDGRKPLPT